MAGGTALLALLVPVAIFGSGKGMLTIAFAIYFFLFYLVDSFCFYLTSPAPERMHAAEQNATEVEHAVEAWKARGGYRQTGLLQPIAAQDIGISRYRLTTWLHQRGQKYTEWMAQLRVEEAKHTIATHPDWSNDAIAQHCGFTDRTVLQRTFKKIEGITPQKYLENLSKGECFKDKPLVDLLTGK
ncbi:MAG: AraC family transcriptional regulator [Prevotella sp.]|nr:AraC family transcriptional regulator [Prevotella sp.]